jgi:hypothetical protein
MSPLSTGHVLATSTAVRRSTRAIRSYTDNAVRTVLGMENCA